MTNEDVRIEYDYVVIGSGAGGGPLAANLVKNGYRVLVLEAGRDGRDEATTQAPLLHPASTENDQLRWNYYVKHFSDPEQAKKDHKYAEDVKLWGDESDDPNNQPKPGDAKTEGILYPRFSALGGCTAHNAMITVAPHNSDWDRIADMTRDDSWRAENMRNYWQRFEKCDFGPAAKLNGFIQALFQVFNIPWNPQRRGYAGYLRISKVIPKRALKDKKLARIIKEVLEQFVEESDGTVLEKLKRIVYDFFGRNFDPNSWKNLQERRGGVAITPLSIERGQRIGPREYLIKTRKQNPEKLVIKTNCLVTRILFDRSGEVPRASGVEFVNKGDLYDARRQDAARPAIDYDTDTQEVYVRREVIVACGAFNTPQLLMLSGIGPEDQLKKAGYSAKSTDIDSQPVKVLNGVGRNLQDRYEVGVVTKMRTDLNALRDVTLTDHYSDPQFQLWSRKRKGVYQSNGAIIGIITRSLDNKPDPDLYIFGIAGYFRGYYPGYSKDGFKDGRRNWFTWAVLKGHTKNQRGYVQLRDDDPQSVPEINFRYFNDDPNAPKWEWDDDLRSVVEGVKYVRRLNKDPQMREILNMDDPEEHPGPLVKTDEELRDFCKHQSWGHHASCTCPIGPEDPADENNLENGERILEYGGVLDENFKVHGVNNLRVVDASVFPRIPGLFIVSAVYMISEKATDAILADAEKPETYAHAERQEIEREDDFQKDEEEQIQRIIGTLRAKLAGDYAQAISKRDTHPKSNGLIRAYFRVLPGLPPEYRQGIFAVGHANSRDGYKTFIRYSNASPEVTPDYAGDFRGIGVKLVGLPESVAPGDTIIVEDDPGEEKRTQDFLMIQTPNFFAGVPKDFADFFEAIYRGWVTRITRPIFGNDLSRMFGVIAHFILPRMRLRHGRVLLSRMRKVFKSPLEIEWFGIAPYRFGLGQVVKYKIRPREDQPLTTKLPKKKRLTPDYLRQRMTEQLADDEDDYVLDFLVQFRKPGFEDKLPIDDVSIKWSEKIAPFQKVAEIVIPAQDFNTLQLKDFDENLSFNPWHTREPHRPLGAINRARRKVMKAISDFRLERNEVERYEPTVEDWDRFQAIDDARRAAKREEQELREAERQRT